MTRALEDGRLRWIVATGALVGFGFLAKELQAFLVLPGFGLVYLLAGPPQLARRDRRTSSLLGLATLVGRRLVGRDRAAVARVEPSVHRRLAEQQLLERAVRLQRLRPADRQRVGQRRRRRPGRRPGRWGPTGLTRMFNAQFGGQISWLLPAALAAARRGPRVHRDARRAPIARAPRSGSGAAGSSSPASRSRSARASSTSTTRSRSRPRSVRSSASARRRSGRAATTRSSACCSASSIAVTALWAYVLLRPHADLVPDAAQRVVGRAASVSRSSSRSRRRCADGVGVVLAIAAIVARPRRARGVHAVDGRAAAQRRAPDRRSRERGGRSGRVRRPGGEPRLRRRRSPGAADSAAADRRLRPIPAAPFAGGRHRSGGGFGGGGTAAPGGRVAAGSAGCSTARRRARRSPRCSSRARGFRWTAAAIGANNAAGYQLASGQAIMAIGGFNGTDPTPTLAQFEQYVRTGEIHYFIAVAAAAAVRRAAARRRARRARSPSGSSRTSPPGPSAAPRSTT